MAFPVVLNGRTYTLADFEGTNYVDGLPDAFEDFVTHAGDIYNDTSTSSAAIGTGSKTFTVSSGKPYQAGTPLRIADAAAPQTNFLDCIVTSYSGTSLVVNAFGFAGSGTKTSWTINIGGAKTVDGTLAISQGGTGATTAAAAATALGLGTGDSPTFAGLTVTGTTSFSDIDIDNVGDIAVDSISGDADSDTSITFDGSDAINIAAGGSTIQSITTSGIDVTGNIDVTTGTNDRTILREFNSSNDLSSVTADNTAFRPFSISALGTSITYGGTDTLIAGNNTVNFYLNSGSVSHNFAFNENGGEISLSDESGAVATLLDQANDNTRLFELIDGSNLQIGLGGSNTTGALIFTKASGAEAARITATGLMGINNQNPDTTLHIGDISSTNATGQGRIKLEDTSASLANDGGLEFVTSAFASGYGWKINSVDSSGVHLDFGTRQNSTTWGHKARFLNDGRVAIGDTTTNNAANRLKVQGSEGDDRIAISTASTSGNATVEAQVANYWSGTTYTGTGIIQHDSAASGTTAGISNANLGMLRFQNGSAGLILTNGSTPIHFGTQGTKRMTLTGDGEFGVGTDVLTDDYKMIIEGSDQESTDITDAGTHGATLFLRATAEGAGSGGAIAFGTTFGNQRPFAAIKGAIVDGTANTVGDLAFAMRNATGDTALTTRMTLTQEGYLGIGEANPTHRLEVEAGSLGTTSGDSISIFNSAFRSSNLDNIEFTARRTSNGTDWQTAAQRIQRKVDTTLMGFMQFGNNSSDLITFGKGTSEYARIDGDGNWLVGTTDTVPSNNGASGEAGVAISPDGVFRAARSGNVVLDINRMDSDGNIADFRKDGSTVGSIFSYNGFLGIGSPSGNDAYLLLGSDFVAPATSTGAARDGAIDLGSSGRHFKDLYLSGTGFVERISTDHDGDWGMEMSGVSTARIRFNSSAGGSTTVGSITVSTTATAYNQSSDERLKENIVDAPSASDDIDALQVRSFDWKINGEHQKYGMVAQELNMVAPDAVTIPDDPEEMAGVDYSKLVPMLVKEIQSLRARVAQLEGA